MSCWPIDVCNSLRGQVDLADFCTAGDSATSPNSTHARWPGFPQDQLIRSPADASWFVANRVGNGSDYIKVAVQVMTHVTGFNAYQMAIQSKSHIIQHLPADFPVNEAMARTMLAQKQVSCSTLTVDKATVDTYHPAGWSYSTSVQSLWTLDAVRRKFRFWLIQTRMAPRIPPRLPQDLSVFLLRSELRCMGSWNF